MFEEVLSEIREAEVQSENKIQLSKEKRHEKIKDLIEGFEKELESLSDYEKLLHSRVFEEERKKAEQESSEIKNQFNKEISKIKEISQNKFEQAISHLMEGIE
jgi:vacuolar-type H+-ATPase subunit H